jgi:UDP:flavonoid glycosyltransferase YjiC (YdhE family)
MTRLKIIFACIPSDGHFNPLTRLAVHLKSAGHDVRWYTQNLYEQKIKSLDIPYYPFRKALQLNHQNLNTVFPQRLKYKSQLTRLNFDLENLFVRRGPEFYYDLRDIHNDFPFDVMIADVAFTGIPFVREKMRKPVLAIGIVPLIESSKDLPPYGLGLTPSKSAWGRAKQKALRWLADKVLFGKVNRLFQNILRQHAIVPTYTNVFDTMIRKSILLLQNGTPGFEYVRSDLGENIRFLGPLLPYREKTEEKPFVFSQPMAGKKVIVVTQGTVEKDVEKLIVPALEAFKDSDYLVFVTTGNSQTQELRKRYPQPHFTIEDFIPFAEIMPYADAYITNGGYGGVLLGIQHGLPMVVAGIHEGKNEINARVRYFRLGIDLKTEMPSPEQIYKTTLEILENPEYKRNVEALCKEFKNYDPEKLCERYVYEVMRMKYDEAEAE